MKKKFISVLLLILMTYVNMPFYFAGITSLHKLSYYVLSVLPFCVALYFGIRMNMNIRLFFIFFLFYFVTVILAVLCSGDFDIQYMIYFLCRFFGICAGLSVFFIYRYFQHKYSLRISFNRLFLKSVLFYIYGTIFFIVCPPLKTFWSSILADLGQNDFSNVIEYATRFGFAGFSGFWCTFMVCVATVVCCYLFLNNEISLKQMKRYSLVLLAGSFFYGRVGLVVTFLTLGLFSLYLLFHKKPRLVEFYLFLLVFIICLVVSVYFIFPDTRAVIEWAFEPVLNFFQHGEFSSASTDSLGNMYKNFNPSDATLLHGDGYWLGTDGKGYYGKTDVGFMRNIYYGGVFYTAILYAVPISFICLFYVLLKQRGKHGSSFFSFLMFFQLLVFEFKGDIAFIFLKFYLPCFFSVLYEKTCLISKYRIVERNK